MSNPVRKNNPHVLSHSVYFKKAERLETTERAILCKQARRTNLIALRGFEEV